MREEKNEYPCNDCADEPKCILQEKYKRCRQWLVWFRKQWRALQKQFARNVSIRHDEKGGDDE